MENLDILKEPVEILLNKIKKKENTFTEYLNMTRQGCEEDIYKKLSSLYLFIEDDNVLELAYSKYRNIRYCAILCIIEKIKFFINKKDNENLEKYYPVLIPSRSKDIDGKIRFLIYEFYIFLLQKNKQYFIKNFDILNFGLFDREIKIRKLILNFIKELFFDLKKNRNEIISLKNNIFKLANIETNKANKKLASSIACQYLENKIVDDIELFNILNVQFDNKLHKKIIKNFNMKNKIVDDLAGVDFSLIDEPVDENYKKYSYMLLDKESIYSPEILHILSNYYSNRKLIFLTGAEIEKYFQFLRWIYEKNITCCSKKYCFYLLIKTFKFKDTHILKYLTEQLNFHRSDEKIIKILIENLEKIDNLIFLKEIEETKNLLNFIGSRRIAAFGLFKKLGDDFKNDIIQILQNYTLDEKIIYFNFSAEVDEQSNFTAKIYSIFWLIIEKEFEKIECIKFLNLKETEVNIFFEFLQFYYEKCTSLNIIESEYENITDLLSCFNRTFHNLIILGERNINLISAHSNFIFFLNRNYFTDNLEYVFKKEQLKNLSKIKNKELLFKKYFTAYENLNGKVNINFLLRNLKRGTVKFQSYFIQYENNIKFIPVLRALLKYLSDEEMIYLHSKLRNTELKKYLKTYIK